MEEQVEQVAMQTTELKSPEDVQEEIVEVALHSMVGVGSPKTIKLKGFLGSTEVIVLVDSGVTHNFIALQLVRKLDLQLTETGGYGIILGTGSSVRGVEICKNVVLSLGTIIVMQDFLLIELGTANVILGVKWLETLGDVTSNHRSLQLSFTLNGSKVVLQGDPSLVRSQVTLKTLIKELKLEK